MLSSTAYKIRSLQGADVSMSVRASARIQRHTKTIAQNSTYIGKVAEAAAAASSSESATTVKTPTLSDPLSMRCKDTRIVDMLYTMLMKDFIILICCCCFRVLGWFVAFS